MNRLITERLVLQPYTEADFEAFSKMHSDPVLKANTHAKPLNRLQARELFDGYLSAFKRDGFGMMNIRKTNGNYDVGECGLWYRSDIGGFTLRYTIRKDYWNQGYSAEAVRAIVSDAFQSHSMNAIQAIAMKHNHRSVRVLEKAGFSKVSDEFRGISGFLRFILTAEEYSKHGLLTPARGV
jgi:ribosomal-protein-alanine N-acetyltransferase